MGSRSKVDARPPVLRGMKVLDRDAFSRVVPIVAAKSPAQMTLTVRDAMDKKKAVLRLPRLQNIKRAEDGDRLILLDAENEAELPQAARDFLKEHSIPVVPYTLELEYDYWLVDDVLSCILPDELVEEKPSSFTVIGHVAHINLNDEYLPWKHIIGQVILDKNSGYIRTVVNKTETIQDNTYRVFPMEVIAGVPDTLVQQRESGCYFKFDFSEVYWNSRLGMEHARIISKFKPEDLVVDVFAGVGPFAIPAAKKGCAVLANDLNPNCYKWMLVNIAENKVEGGLVRPSCSDGRDFIREVFNRAYDEPLPPVLPPKLTRAQEKQAARERAAAAAAARKARRDRARASGSRTPSPSPINARLPSPPAPIPQPRRHIDHFVMNLPLLAIDFLDAFKGVLSPANAGTRAQELGALYDSEQSMPMIHCYCFTRETEYEKAEAEIKQRVEAVLGEKLEGEASVFWVRSVAPNKELFCISFRLPYNAAYATHTNQ